MTCMPFGSTPIRKDIFTTVDFSDPLVWRCTYNTGMRLEVINSIFAKIVQSNPIWFDFESGSFDLSKLREDSDIARLTLSNDFFYKEGDSYFIKVDDLHIFDRGTLTHWLTAQNSSKNCPLCNQTTGKYISFPALKAFIENNNSFNSLTVGQKAEISSPKVYGFDGTDLYEIKPWSKLTYFLGILSIIILVPLFLRAFNYIFPPRSYDQIHGKRPLYM